MLGIGDKIITTGADPSSGSWKETGLLTPTGKLGDLVRAICDIANEDFGLLYVPIYSEFNAGDSTNVVVLVGAVSLSVNVNEMKDWPRGEKTIDFLFKIKIKIEKKDMESKILKDYALNAIYNRLLKRIARGGLRAMINNK